MCNFVLENIEEVPDNGAVIQFRKLNIDSKCQFDDFCAEVYKNGTYNQQLDQIFASCQMIAIGRSVSQFPPKKLNSIRDKGTVIAHEFKSNNLRVYFKIRTDNVVIILGGYKNDQKSDIKKLIRILSTTQL